MSEQDYIRGFKAACGRMLRVCMAELNPDEKKYAALVLEREESVAALRDVCGEFGDNDWPDDLHLADVIEKHLGRNLRG